MRRSSSSRVPPSGRPPASSSPNDAAITAGHRNGVAGFVDAQEQQADLFLALGIGNRLARDDRNAHDLAIIVLQRQISGLDP
ncbi:hypothetical protein G6F46_014838 [Rhizopus delemar]|nr:hypothetical protein G6F46_014838 [Rhizopus delemar]